MTEFRRDRLAVLAADVAGYTRLMEEREEETHARLRRLLVAVVRPALAEHRGTIVKSTGDGFLASFDSAEDAAACAIAVQAAAAREAREAPASPLLLFRMGVTLADVIIEADDIFGEGVNLAARLQGAAEPGGVLASSEVAAALRGKPGIELAELGALPLKNIARPVRAFAVRVPGSPVAAPATLPRGPSDGRPSIAVLPFRTRPGAEEDAYFAEGVIEGILHVLAGLEALFVIARGSTQLYAGRGPIDPRAVRAELGVRYVLSGSVYRAGSRLRIATELADAVSGAVVRVDRHDGAATDIFEMQDTIAARTVVAIAPCVRARELQVAMRKHPDSLTSYDFMLQALHLLHRVERDTYDRARGLLQRAIAEDPGFASPWSHAAFWHMLRIGQGWSPDPQVDAAEAARCADAALSRDPTDAVALAVHGHMLSFARRDLDGAAAMLECAVQAGPSCPLAWTFRSATAGYRGEGDEAVAWAEQAIRLSPDDPLLFLFEHLLSQAYYVRGDFEAAARWGHQAARRNGRMTSNLRTLAAALVALGQMEAARAVAGEMLAVDPGFRLTTFGARTPFKPEIRETHVARLRVAGLPL